MLDRLPLELLQAIVREAAPITHDYNKYKTRQRILKRLSLVSRALRPVAQEVLGEVVVAQLLEYICPMGAPTDDDDFLHLLTPRSLREGWHRIAPALTVLVLRPCLVVPENPVTYPTELALCRSLRDLTLGQIELELDLRRLVLYDCKVACPAVAPIFPSLGELSLRHITFDGPIKLTRFFSKRHLPALRLLAAVDIQKSGTPKSARFVPDLGAWDDPPFFVVGGDNAAGWPALDKVDPLRTLWTLDLEGSDGGRLDLPYFPLHLYLAGNPFFYDDEGEAELDLMFNHLVSISGALLRCRERDPSQRPSTLILPHGLAAHEHDDIEDVLSDFLRDFEGATILWEEGGLESFSAVPEIFLEHQRRAQVEQKEQQ
ncbi:hypothetical protein JCM8097_002486 [Rhodosporidiobolus ruineniae]